MRVWTALLAYLAWIFGGAAVLAPCLWEAAHGLAASTGAPWAAALADHPFHRYVSRCLQVLALSGVYPFARALGCRGWADLGWSRDPKLLRHLGWGAGLGASTIVLGWAVESSLELRSWREGLEAARVLRAVCGGLLAGLAVGVAEETLFRGLLLGALQRVAGTARALAVSSLLYAALHFLERGSSPAHVGPWSGAEAIAHMFAGFGAADRLLPRLITLVAAGLALGLLLLRTRSLAASVALHGTWVFGVKLRGALTVPGGGAADGRASDWVTLGVMLLALGTSWILFRRAARMEGPSQAVSPSLVSGSAGVTRAAGAREG